MKGLRIVWEDIRSGENLDVYITIALALAAAILGLAQQVDQSVISAAILGTLALLTIFLLQNRWVNAEIKESLSGLKGSTLSANEPRGYDEQRGSLREAVEVFFWGVTLRKIVPHLEHQNLFSQKLENGMKARFLLLKPESDVIHLAGQRLSDQSEGVESRINSALNQTFYDLKEIFEKAGEQSNGSMEVRLTGHYLPPFTVSAFIGPRGRSGKVFVSLLTYKLSDTKRTSFILDLESRTHREIYQSIRDQFDILWEESDPKSLASSLS